jgi:hypothetical protein
MKTCQSSINQSTQQRALDKVQDRSTQVLANENSSKEGGPLGEWEQIKYPDSQVVRSISNKERQGTLQKKQCLAYQNPHLH